MAPATDPESKLPVGRATVRYATPAEAQKAVDILPNIPFLGVNLNFRLSRRLPPAQGAAGAGGGRLPRVLGRRETPKPNERTVFLRDSVLDPTHSDAFLFGGLNRTSRQLCGKHLIEHCTQLSSRCQVEIPSNETPKIGFWAGSPGGGASGEGSIVQSAWAFGKGTPMPKAAKTQKEKSISAPVSASDEAGTTLPPGDGQIQPASGTAKFREWIVVYHFPPPNFLCID